MHAAIARDLLSLRHLKRVLQRRRHILPTVRVHGDRFAQLLGRAGHLTEHQHTRSIRLCRDEFLGDQVHAIAHRRHQRDVGQVVQRHQRLEWHRSVQVPDGNPADRGVFAVQIANALVDLPLQFLVRLHGSSRRHSDQDERDPFAIRRIALQEKVEGIEPLQDALGVVETIYGEDEALLADLLADAADLLLHDRLGDGTGIAVIVDPHGEDVGPDDALAGEDLTELGFMPQEPAHGA